MSQPTSSDQKSSSRWGTKCFTVANVPPLLASKQSTALVLSQSTPILEHFTC